MEIAAAILIGLGVIIGGVMAPYGLQKQHIPKGLAIAHGALVITGILLLFIYALTTGSHHKHWDSLTVFLMAGLVGFYLLEQDIRKKHFRPWVLIVHAAIGLAGITWLTIHLLS